MTVFDLVVAGRVVLPGADPAPAELGVSAGRIAAIAEPGVLEGAERLDAPDHALLLPGHVDVHVHTRSEPEEGITSATTAAAAGGATTVVDMPYDDPEPITTVERFLAKADDIEREAITDVALWATIPKSGGLDEIPSLVEAGACAFKVSTFETHPVRFPRIADGELYLALQRVRDADSLVAFHAESDDVVRRLSDVLARQGRTDADAHAEARPPVAETEAIGRVLELALATGARVHLAHVTVERGFTLVERARADGVDVTAETCTHYLLLDEGELSHQGARAKINPPLRSRREVEALWRLLHLGRVDLVTSDHVGWLPERKRAETIFAARAGVPGLELTLPLLHSEGVARRRLPLRRLIEVLCEHPARRFGLWPRKGGLVVGADADVVVFHPDERWTVDEASLATPAGWSPYHGLGVTGRVVQVLVRGRTVYERGAVVGRPGDGTFVRPSGSRHLPSVAARG